MQQGHITLPNGFGVDYPSTDGGEAEITSVPPNELTYIGHQDEFAGTPWHKHVPARVEGATELKKEADSMTVEEYLDTTPEPQRSTLSKLRAMLASILPEAEETISYGVPAFKVDGTAVAGYAAAKRHCSYFPHSGSVISQVEPALLEGYDWSKGTLRFPIDTVPDEALIRRLVEIRLAMLGR